VEAHSERIQIYFLPDNYKGKSMNRYHGLIVKEAMRIFKSDIESGALSLIYSQDRTQNLVGNDSECAKWQWK